MIKCQLCEFSNAKSILSHVRTEHNLSAKEYKTSFPGSSLRESWLKNNVQAMEEFRLVGKANSDRNKGRISPRRLKEGVWSREHAVCVTCGKTDSAHSGNGVCKNCYCSSRQLERTELKNKTLASTGSENIDFVICQECGKPFECLMTHGHLKEHGMTELEYQKKHGCDSTRPSRLIGRTSIAISAGRRKLMKDRGFLNPQSQRDGKRLEMTRRMSEARTSPTSGPEELVSSWLASKGLCVIYSSRTSSYAEKTVYRQFPLLGKYVVDFAIPSEKIVIEVLGTYWHGWDFINGKKRFEDFDEAVKKNVCTDKIRFAEIISSGWKCIEVWEHDIASGKLDDILLPYLTHIASNTDVSTPQLGHELVLLKTIAPTIRKLYNARWLAAQNDIVVLPGSLISVNDIERLDTMVKQAGEDRAIPPEIISAELKRCRQAGFPVYNLSREEMVRKWVALNGANVTQRQDGNYLWDGFGTDLASMFHPHIFDCKKRGKISPVEFFADDDLLTEAIYKALCLFGYTNDSRVRDACRNAYRSSRVNNFPPKVAITIARLLLSNENGCASVLDPCAGFGGRLLGFAASGVKKYVGIDLSEKTCAGLKQESEFLKSYGATTDIDIIHGDSVQTMSNMESSSFDLVMTSPPFTDREEYVGVPFHSALSDWIDQFMRPMLDHAFRVLKDGKCLALYLGKSNDKTNKLPNIVDGLAVAAGFHRDNLISFVTTMGESNRRRMCYRETSVQVWRKA